MIQHYIDMLADRERVETIQRAIAATVRPGDIVVDVGTGTGAFALFAAKAGAARVYAVERGEVAELAQEMMRENGVDDVVRVVRADAGRWVPPEPVDVVIFEDFADVGVGPEIARLSRHWTKHLAPGGRFVPESVSVHVAAVEHESEHLRGFPWPNSRAYGLDVTPMRALADNARTNCHILPSHVLSDTRVVVTHRLGEPLDANVDYAVELRINRRGRLHGLAVFFELDLGSGIRFSNAPAPVPTIWQCAFLHTRDAAPVDASDVVRLEIGHFPWGPETWHWRWEMDVRSEQGAPRHHERRSSLFSETLSIAGLRAMSLDQPAPLGSELDKLRECANLIDGERSYREVAALLIERLPEDFDGLDDAATYVRQILGGRSTP